jgi:1-aminocyclopropane-1-carboxylate deaminase
MSLSDFPRYLAFGGNKTRKLEYLAPDALAQGADALVSIGGVQSNPTRQVAAVAAKLGLKARLVQENWVNWPDTVNDRVGNILLSRTRGDPGAGGEDGAEHRRTQGQADTGPPPRLPESKSPVPSGTPAPGPFG